ncbi:MULTISPECIES: class I mannose-6-phosphate isomerase [unclassified Breznakia]|uniref:class I mannose-6-phosphate isomerase n=1 Tax=unclassified Breznakia TaxID=2623764 RepID=UPI0024065E89|nr:MULTISPECIES: class I mannose-6-phosphate isomerase [unclassified Breznakia]
MLENFNYQSDIYPVGEVYNVVALKNHADCLVKDTCMTLSDLYITYPEWFKCDTNELPIRVNILDPEADLSIQLHPDDAFARSYNGGRGKPEAWVILDAPEDGYIAFGHTAKTRDEFEQKVGNKEFDSLIKYIDVVVDDYIDIPCGTIHAIGKDVLTYNISRNADCTLRVYDYDRLDPATGKTRDLQVEEVIKNVNIPDKSKGFVHYPEIEQDGCLVTSYWDEPGLYTLKRIRVKEHGYHQHQRFAFYTIVEGEAKINDVVVRKGETIFVPDQFGLLEITGDVDMFMASYENSK